MTCPRCKCEIPNDSKVCEVCGKKLQKKKLFASFKERKKGVKSVDSAVKKDTKFKIILAVVITVAIIGVIVAIILKIDDNSGLNLSDDLKEFVGEPVKTAINESDVYFADESAFDAANFITEFDYIIEDDKSVEIDGVKYPKWAIFIEADEKDTIEVIRYVDFSVLKKNSKGEKVDSEINLDKFAIGDKFKKVAKVVDCDAFSITYEGGSVAYEYRYYFKNDYKDEQGMTLNVVCDLEGGFIYSTTQRQIPDYID